MIPAAVVQDGGETVSLPLPCFSSLSGWLPLKFLTHAHAVKLAAAWIGLMERLCSALVFVFTID